jgi:hypothetical protein
MKLIGLIIVILVCVWAFGVQWADRLWGGWDDD